MRRNYSIKSSKILVIIRFIEFFHVFLENITQNLVGNRDDLLNMQEGKFKEIKVIPQIKNKFSFDDISFDYISNFLEENAKTSQKNIEFTNEKLEKVFIFSNIFL